MKIVNNCPCLLLLLFAYPLVAQTYIPSDNHSSVTFVIRNFGFNVEGSFTHLQGSISFDPNNLPAAAFNLTVGAATVSTGNNSRDTHLKKEEYFNVAKYPVISFSSDKIEKAAAGGGYIATGRFTIKGKSKSVSVRFTALPPDNGYLFTGKTGLNRRNFEVGGDSFALSDNLTLTLSIFAPGVKK